MIALLIIVATFIIGGPIAVAWLVGIVLALTLLAVLWEAAE